MTDRYSGLLSPVMVGNVILKNRMTATASTPHFLQGTEVYPTEKFITHFANRAKNGAAVVTISPLSVKKRVNNGRLSIENEGAHYNRLDPQDYSCQNYLCQTIDTIHFYGAKALAYIPTPDIEMPQGVPSTAFGPYRPGTVFDLNLITEEIIDRYIADIVENGVTFKKLGFDMLSFHCCYRGYIHTHFLSPLTNNRTDEWGGSLSNRARFILRIFESLKNACGKDFPLECVISVSEPEGGYTVNEMIEFAKLAEGKIDILQFRGGEIDPQHPTGFTSTPENPTPFLGEIALVKESVKARGGKILIGASAGFQDIDWANRAITEGKADLICMARTWINNPEYGKLAYSGRGEDVVPCIRCNKCHVSNHSDTFRAVCSVNPILGLEDKIDRMISPSASVKKVAVIGGGPAGLKAAAVAAERGHKVTLYEKSNYLGGELKHADYASFKWPLKHFKDHLVQQVYRNGVNVNLNTEVSQELLKAKGYDAVIVAIGSRPVVPRIPGADGENVIFANAVFGHESTLDKKIAVIGGGEIGVETGMHLAELGYEVTVIEMLGELIDDAPRAHYRGMVETAWKALKNFNYVLNARCTRIDAEGVTYLDKEGIEQKLEAGNVVLAVGTKAKAEEALAFYGTGAVTCVIGDCDKAGSVQKAIRSAFAAATQI